MRWRVLDLDLPIKGSVVSCLTNLYGIGRQRSWYVCSILGLGKSAFAKNLNNYYKEGIRLLFLEDLYMLGQVLKAVILQKLESYEFLWIYKGFRFKNKLSMRGQRTSTNCKSIKRFIKKWKSIF